MISEYELYFKTPMSLSELLEKFTSMGYPADVKLTKDGLHLKWKNGISAMLEAHESWGGSNKYELKVENKEHFMTLHDILMSMGVCVNKYEAHVKTDLDIMGVKNRIESLGVRTVMDLTPDGIEWHIMNGNGNGYMNVQMELYDEDAEGKEYEFCVKTKDEFMKLHDMLNTAF